MTEKRRVVPFNQKKTDNLAVILFFVTFIVFGIINLVDKRTPLLTTGSVWYDSLAAVGLFIVGMFVHEGLHALAGIVFGKVGVSAVRFGFDLKNGNLYTHFASPMPATGYAATLIAPFVITALAPVTAFGGPILLAPCCLLLAACAGDLVMFVSVMKGDRKALIQDHPEALAYYLVYPNGNEPEGFSERTEEEEKEALKDSVVTYRDEKARKKNMLFKCLGILLFIALYVLAMYLLSLLMQFI